MAESVKKCVLYSQMSLRDRLEIQHTPEPNSGCWLWIGACDRKGNGKVQVSGVAWYAHRASFTLHRGPIPGGMHVLHKCDTPACINPEHLFLGSNADNHLDKIAKGRHAFGMGNAAHKLTEAQVAAIRFDARTQQVIADSYGVSPSTISLIKLGKTWARSAIDASVESLPPHKEAE